MLDLCCEEKRFEECGEWCAHGCEYNVTLASLAGDSVLVMNAQVVQSISG